MKILAISDIHGDRKFIKKMAEKGAREKVDLVLMLGDIIGWDGNVEGFVGPFKDKGLDVALLPGNHEGMAEIGFMLEKYKAMDLHGKAIVKGDVGIFGCGYGDIGPHELDDEQFFKMLKKGHDKVKNVKKRIMVTHVEPNDCVLSMKVPGWGSKGVRKAINEFKPMVHLCGHIHETHGIEEKIGETRVVNVGKTGFILDI
jgi:uncharacterized protein